MWVLFTYGIRGRQPQKSVLYYLKSYDLWTEEGYCCPFFVLSEQQGADRNGYVYRLISKKGEKFIQ